MKSLIFATLDTASFRFEAFAATKREARALMRKTWAFHRWQFDARDQWTDIAPDVWYRRVTMGQAYRDATPVPPAAWNEKAAT